MAGERGGVGLSHHSPCELGEDRRAVGVRIRRSSSGNERPGALLRAPRRSAPRRPRRRRRCAATARRRSASAVHPRGRRGRELARRVALEQDQRPHAVGVAQREVGRHGAAVAAADHHRRRLRQGVEQRGRVVGVLGDARALVGLRALAARRSRGGRRRSRGRAARAPDRVAPGERGAAAAVDAEDRGAAAVLLVVEPDAVDGRAWTCARRYGPRPGGPAIGRSPHLSPPDRAASRTAPRRPGSRRRSSRRCARRGGPRSSR